MPHRDEIDLIFMMLCITGAVYGAIYSGASIVALMQAGKLQRDMSQEEKWNVLLPTFKRIMVASIVFGGVVLLLTIVMYFNR